MSNPEFVNEKKLFSKGIEVIVGLDEAGRGAWAGPIVAGAVLITPPRLVGPPRRSLSEASGLASPSLFKGRKSLSSIYRGKGKLIIRDSKLLSASQRMRAYEFLTKNFVCAFGIVESEQIDLIGISRANQLAMDYALAKFSTRPDFALIDGRGFRFDIPYENIIDGDAKVFCIAAASIIAKVVRDEIMKAYDSIFEGYGFFQHKGYGTRIHQEALKKHGVSSIHRRSYSPIKRLLGK